MALRKKLQQLADSNDVDGCIDVICNANPATLSLTDLLFLLRLGNARSNNKLGHLQVEAETWIHKNRTAIQKRVRNG